MQAYFKKKPLNPKPVELDDSLSLEEGTLSVTNPTHSDVLTKAEYDALPEEQRNAGIYVVENGEEEDLSSYDTVYVQSYDTPDGWYVRKHSDGYVEMALTVTEDIPASVWQKWETVYYAIYSQNLTVYNYPVRLVTKYIENYNASIYGNSEETSNDLWTSSVYSGFVLSANHTDKYVHVRPDRPGVDTKMCRHFFVTGRWK